MEDNFQTLSVASVCKGVRSLGPGKRNVIWLQGCPFNCIGCISPEFRTFAGGETWPVEELIAWHRASPCDGLTISGGEPLYQASGLALFLDAICSETSSIILYTGYTLTQAQRRARKEPQLNVILRHCDVLIDGLYDHGRNDGAGLRGSENQTVHFLTSRHEKDRSFFETSARHIEHHVQHDGILHAGLPKTGRWPHDARPSLTAETSASD